MSGSRTPTDRAKANELRRRAYARDAAKYDKQIGFLEKWVIGSEHRGWACSKAVGNTLEVGIGTGLNLPHYSRDLRLTGLDLTSEMLEIARKRAMGLGLSVEFKEGDAQELPFKDASFDTVVCTYSLCNVPDVSDAVSEMKRVLKTGGRLILVDHIRSTSPPILWLQRLIEFFESRTEGEYMTRRPLVEVQARGFQILARDRMRAGVIERLVALKPNEQIASIHQPQPGTSRSNR